jgi:hypothetical protein
MAKSSRAYKVGVLEMKGLKPDFVKEIWIRPMSSSSTPTSSQSVSCVGYKCSLPRRRKGHIYVYVYLTLYSVQIILYWAGARTIYSCTLYTPLIDRLFCTAQAQTQVID